MRYGVWRTAKDYFSGAGPRLENDSLESLVRRAVEAIPKKGRSHMIVAREDDTAPPGWVNLGAITCGCDQFCRGEEGTVQPLRKDLEVRDRIRLRQGISWRKCGGVLPGDTTRENGVVAFGQGKRCA